MKNLTQSTFFAKKRSLHIFHPLNIYPLFFLICFSITILTCFFYVYLRHLHTGTRDNVLATEAQRIENTLDAVFLETQQVLQYVGNRIRLHSDNDPKLIEKILRSSAEIAASVKTTYSWTLLDWIDAQSNKIIINSQLGIVETLYMKYYSTYIESCKKTPWKLQLSYPTIGNTSGMWVIPSGIGVTNKHNHYMGTLMIGFNIAQLNAKIENIIPQTVNFIILDNELKIILKSTNNSIDPKSSYYRDILTNSHIFSKSEGLIHPPIHYKNIEYTFYKKTKNYPYTILTGFDKQAMGNEFWSLFVPRFVELCGVGGFCLLLVFLRRRMFRAHQASEHAKNLFEHQTKSKMKKSIEFIYECSTIFVRYFHGDSAVLRHGKEASKLMEELHQHSLNLHTLATNSLKLTYIDINMLIKDAINIQNDVLIQRDIKITSLLESNLPVFYGDAFRLKQALIGLIALSLNYSPKGTKIHIATCHTLEKEGAHLTITLEDNGFTLSEEDIARLTEHFSNEESLDSTEGYLEFSDIQKLFSLHHGSCYIDSTCQTGKMVVITLPYRTESTVKIPEKQGKH